jgi:hypothetical protein
MDDHVQQRRSDKAIAFGAMLFSRQAPSVLKFLNWGAPSRRIDVVVIPASSVSWNRLLKTWRNCVISYKAAMRVLQSLEMPS